MYRIAQRPVMPLADIPAYPYEKYQMRGASLPIGSVDSAVRTRAEEALTQFASTVESGYVVADSRLLAGKGGQVRAFKLAGSYPQVLKAVQELAGRRECLAIPIGLSMSEVDLSVHTRQWMLLVWM